MITKIHVGFLKTEYGVITINDSDRVSYTGGQKNIVRKVMTAYTLPGETPAKAAKTLPKRLRNYWWAYSKTQETQ